MWIARLNKINMYFLLGFYYFAIHLSATQLFEPLVKDKNFILQGLPGFIPFMYVMMLCYLTFASLTLKPNRKQNLTNA